MEIPGRFLKVLEFSFDILDPGSPKVLDNVAEVEIHVSSDFDALNAAWMSSIMLRMVDHVICVVCQFVTPLQIWLGR